MAPLRPNYPSGYRFLPKDWELIINYLAKKIAGIPLPSNHILEVETYDYSPEDIFKNYELSKDEEWYFFSSRKQKYPKGTRPKRDAGAGRWKLTGRDEKIFDENGRNVGYKRTLVYYRGKAKSKDEKTNWAMVEYEIKHKGPKTPSKDMVLDKWVLNKIYRIKQRSSKKDQNNQSTDQNGEKELKAVGPPEQLTPVNNQGRVYRDMTSDEMMNNYQMAPSTSHSNFIRQSDPQPSYNHQINPYDAMKLNEMMNYYQMAPSANSHGNFIPQTDPQSSYNHQINHSEAMKLNEITKYYQMAPSANSHGNFIPQSDPQPSYNHQINPSYLMNLDDMMLYNYQVAPSANSHGDFIPQSDPQPSYNDQNNYSDLMKLDEMMKYYQMPPSASHGDFISQSDPQPSYNHQINPSDAIDLDEMRRFFLETDIVSGEDLFPHSYPQSTFGMRDSEPLSSTGSTKTNSPRQNAENAPESHPPQYYSPFDYFK